MRELIVDYSILGLIGSVEQSMDGDMYYGFAIGPTSDSALIEVVTPQGLLVLTPGMVYPITPARFVPRVRPSAIPRHLDGAAHRVHVLGLTSCHELAITPRRAIYTDQREGFAIADTATETSNVRFQGRRHAQWVIESTRTLDGTILGWRFMGAPNFDFMEVEIEAGIVIPASTPTSFHLGGTNEEEGYDLLTLELFNGSGASATVHRQVWAFGELGD